MGRGKKPEEPLTPEEAKIMEDNMGLIYNATWRLLAKYPKMKYEDAYDVCVDAMLPAIKKFNPEKSQFSTHYNIWVRGKLSKFFYRVVESKERAIPQTSYDNITRDKPTLYKQLIRNTTAEENHAFIDRQEIDGYLKILTWKQRRTFEEYYGEGLTRSEIAKRHGTTRWAVTKILKLATERVQEHAKHIQACEV